MILAANLASLKGIGDNLLPKFAKLEIHTVADLLFSYPRQYLDYSRQVKITELSPDSSATLIVEVKSTKNVYLRNMRGKTIQKAIFTDKTGSIEATWFNMPFVIDALKVGEKYALIAKLKLVKNKAQLSAPIFERFSPLLVHTGRIVPAYNLTAGLSPKIYRRIILNLLTNLSEITDFPLDYNDQLLTKIKAKVEFPNLKEALKQVHFPESFEQLRNAQFRLGVEELVPIQRKLQLQANLRSKALTLTHKDSIPVIPKNIVSDYWTKYDFSPTPDQLTACKEILAEFNTAKPIYHLIQGDVGSGKTAVAGFAIQLALLAKTDVIVLVPTTILAHQHQQTFSKLFPNQVELVTTNTKNTPQNTPKLWIGTQALLHRYKDLKLKLGMIIVDEEHRFGVRQRSELGQLLEINSAIKVLPHYLSLSATPIPRSLALAIFGNIKITIIKDKPKHQLAKLTYIVSEQKRISSYQWIGELINKGYQAYWLCPLIEIKKEVEGAPVIYLEPEKNTVEEKYLELKSVYPNLKLEKLHGKLKPEIKEKILNDFRAEKFNILVTTSVIEVGIDIPNANIIVIESANRFGLAQLHQLRGRVGRSTSQGYCLLFPDKNISPEGQARLKYFTEEQDGLELARYDLSLRGPGEVYGIIQSGIPNLKIANLNDHLQLEIAKLIVSETTYF